MLLLTRLPGVERLEPDEEAAQPGLRGALDQIAAQDRIDGRRALEEPVHPAHAVEQRAREAPVAEQMVVEEIEMASGQPRDFGERVVHALGVERSAAGEERVLVAEVAVLRAAARDDDGVGHEVAAAADRDRGGSAAGGPACAPTVDR